MDVRLSADDAWELTQVILAVLADFSEVDPERVRGIICESHDGDGDRMHRLTEVIRDELNHILADRTVNWDHLGGRVSKYLELDADVAGCKGV